jgi:hypothetical protein
MGVAGLWDVRNFNYTIFYLLPAVIFAGALEHALEDTSARLPSHTSRLRPCTLSDLRM